jgi:hypothetical protein
LISWSSRDWDVDCVGETAPDYARVVTRQQLVPERDPPPSFTMLLRSGQDRPAGILLAVLYCDSNGKIHYSKKLDPVHVPDEIDRKVIVVAWEKRGSGWLRLAG